MEIQCQCGQFKAEIHHFPHETPGRLGCYCDDCQSYLIYLNRTDLLDKAGCTEVVPVYPVNLKIKEGASHLKCTRLSTHGIYRWSTTCCNSPIANTKRGIPWVGIFSHSFCHKDPNYLDKTLGPVKSRIMGRFAKGNVAPHTAEKINLRSILTVLPFILKGRLFKKNKNSPFFEADGRTPIVKPYILTPREREELHEIYNQATGYPL